MYKCIQSLKKESIMKGKKKEKTYEIPVTWESYGTVKIKAKSLKEACEKIEKDECSIPLPEKKYYVDGSFKNSFDSYENLRDYLNVHEE